MALIVQKYGGTSVGSVERIQSVSERIISTLQQGHDVVVAVSAMAGETNRLLHLANQISEVPEPRELDMLLSAGEQVSIALLAMSLNQKGIKAISLTADQAGIYTNNSFNDATIKHIETDLITQWVDKGYVVIVAGFQGRDDQGNITTLGRGGSDTTAVALAAALDADECQIFTDVDGVYTSDPRFVSNTRRLEEVSFSDMHALAKSGAKVLQEHSVAHAWNSSVALRVLSSFEDGEGTLICENPKQPLAVTGLALKQDLSLVECEKISAEEQAELYKQYRVLNERCDCFQIVVPKATFLQLKLAFNTKIRNISSLSILTLVGDNVEGMAESACNQLLANDIDIHQYDIEPKSVSVIVNQADLHRAAEILHKTFVITEQSQDNDLLVAVS
ncbi:aspartate kinase [Aliivibrio fischeri]|uniref:aspartate kinase n=1 Tax=Aliivibrio fischeri TaxID=668 RepID=UPI00132A7403|nr:aspartate kinase [Aliivibrio fischeri]